MAVSKVTINIIVIIWIFESGCVSCPILENVRTNSKPTTVMIDSIIVPVCNTVFLFKLRGVL